MARAFFQLLRRRRRLLLRPLPQTTFLRRHGGLASHPNPDPRLPADRDLRPANDTPAGLATSEEAPRRDAVAYAATVVLHLRRGDLPRAEALFRAEPASARGPYLDVVMLGGYAKAGRLDLARRLFDGMTVKGVVAWTSLVSGYCRAGRVYEARALFDAMPERNVVSWAAMVQGYARAGMVREARQISAARSIAQPRAVATLDLEAVRVEIARHHNDEEEMQLLLVASTVKEMRKGGALARARALPLHIMRWRTNMS